MSSIDTVQQTSNMTEQTEQREVNMKGTFKERADAGQIITAFILTEDHAAMPDPDFMRGKADEQ